MSKSKNNFIRPGKHGSQVVLDPDFLLCHALYMPDGETIIRSNMTLGQAIEAIAFAHVKAKMPIWQISATRRELNLRTASSSYVSRIALIIWFSKPMLPLFLTTGLL